MTDDFFCAARSKEIEQDISDLLKVKKQQLHAMKVDEAAQEVMTWKVDAIQSLQFNTLSVTDLDMLLHWPSIGPRKMTKQHKVLKLVDIFNSNPTPASFDKWTADDEQNLHKLQEED